MALNNGDRLGPYEISGRLGAGGMGEVFRAVDTKLAREVAIKTLPSTLANDADRLARFEREAQLLAALDHPHIASVYSLGEHEGMRYLAMELVEGETLEERLKRGALPADDALRIALQIAEALEAAHGKGVVHRDLKPANVMLTANGQVKVLDFGLAKAFSGAPGEASPAHSPALSLAMSQAGLVLGTAGYMSPEQASGQGTDQRADVWSFGVVLYEMLTGLPLFRGESVPHILADVLKTEPDWSRLPVGLNPRLRLLLERCLTKKPHNRLHSIADARIEIEAVLGDPTGITAAIGSQVSVSQRPNTRILVASVAVAAVVAGVAGWVLRSPPATMPANVVRFVFDLPMDESAQPTSTIAISPDGRHIAYAREQMYLRDLDTDEVRPIPGTRGGLGVTQPAFSPDGQWLAFVDITTTSGPFVIKRVPISGGGAVTVFASEFSSSGTAFPMSLSWPTTDWLLFTNADGVVRMPANGGAAEVLVPRAEDERLYSPQLLPDGRSVLFTTVPGITGMAGGYDDAEIVVQSIGADDRKRVWSGGSAARYLPSGHIVYAQGSDLFGIAFDLEAREVHGGPVPLRGDMYRSVSGFSDTANFAVSDTGTLVRVRPPTGTVLGTSSGLRSTLVWVDSAGDEEPLALRPDDYTMVRVSPDGTRAAVAVGSALARQTLPSLWIYDFASGNLRQLTTEPDLAINDGPVWSLDGSAIFFRAFGQIEGQIVDGSIYRIELDSGETTLVGATNPSFPVTMPWSLAPDGQTLAVINALDLDDVDFAALALDTGQFSSLLAGPGEQSQPAFSRDGDWIAYSEIPVGGAEEISLRPYPGITRTRIAVGPGATPAFSHDGSLLFYINDGFLEQVPVTYEPQLRIGAPQKLFAVNGYLGNLYGRTWDVDPNGGRFLMIRDPGASDLNSGLVPTPARIDVVLNWFGELRTRIPTDR